MRNHRRFRLLATMAHSGVSVPNTSWKSRCRQMSSGTGMTMRPCRYTSDVWMLTSMDPVGSRHNDTPAPSRPSSADAAASAASWSRRVSKYARAASTSLWHSARAFWHQRSRHVVPRPVPSSSSANASAAAGHTGASAVTWNPHPRSSLPEASEWKCTTHLSDGMTNGGRPWAPYQADGPPAAAVDAVAPAGAPAPAPAPTPAPAPAAPTAPSELPLRRTNGPHVSVNVSSLYTTT